MLEIIDNLGYLFQWRVLVLSFHSLYYELLCD